MAMELLTVQEAASRVGVTAKSIYYSISAGKLTAHKKYGRMLVDGEELGRYREPASGDAPINVNHRAKSSSARGRFKDLLSPVDEFLARKHAENALEGAGSNAVDETLAPQSLEGGQSGYGRFAHMLSSVDEFIANKAAEKAMER